MKKLIILTIAIFSFTQVQSQFYGGVTFGGITSDGKADASLSLLDSELQSKTSVNYGIMGEYRFENGLSLRSKVLFTNKGFQYKQTTNIDVLGFDVPIGAKAQLNIKQVEIPILAQYNHTLGNVDLFVNAGPSISRTNSAQLSTKATFIIDFNVYETDINLDQDYIDRTDINLNFGAGMAYNTPTGKFIIEGSYGLSTNSSISDTFIDTELKNKYLSYNIGYQYRF